MPPTPRVLRRTITVGPDFLPPDATKLTIAYFIDFLEETSSWACIIVGAFYDAAGHPIWSTEVLVVELEADLASGFDFGLDTSRSSPANRQGSTVVTYPGTVSPQLGPVVNTQLSTDHTQPSKSTRHQLRHHVCRLASDQWPVSHALGALTRGLGDTTCRD